MSRHLGVLSAGLVLLAACAARDSSVRPLQAHGIEFRASGQVVEVGGSVLPNTVTIQTTDGPITVTANEETRFELDDDDAPETEADGVRPLHDEDGDGEDDDEQPEEDGFRNDLSQLVGRFVTSIYEPNTLVTEEIQVESTFEVFGRVTAVRDGSVVIAPVGGSTVTLGTDAGTEITIDSADVTNLSALTGRNVQAHYDPLTLVAREIEADTGLRTVRATIAGIEPTVGAIEVRSGRQRATFAVPPGANVNLDFQDSILSELSSGDTAWITYEDLGDGTLAARRIDALTGGRLQTSGRIGEVSESGHTIFIGSAVRRGRASQVRGGKLLKVNGGTQITINGRRSQFARISGGRVTATFVRRDGVLIARTLAVQAARR